MSRNKIKPIKQPDEVTCGPASLKIAMKLLGKHISMAKLIKLCKTNQTGTSTEGMLNAIKQLGLSAMLVKNSTLSHVKSALRYDRAHMRVSIVSYYYDLKKDQTPNLNTAHYAVIASFHTTRRRIVLFDTYYGKRKSYAWQDFKSRWFDFDLKRRKIRKRGKLYRYIHKWHDQPLLVLAVHKDSLPKFKTRMAKIIS